MFRPTLFSVYIICAFLFFSCLGMKGEFGWAIIDESQLDSLERKMTDVQEFTLTREKLVFPNDQTIVYLYKFSKTPSTNAETYVSLSRFQVGYNEVEVTRKRPDPYSSSIRGSFRNLPVGKYLLKVSYDDVVIDSVEFRVISHSETEEDSGESELEESTPKSK
ncbi:hypothetical protein CH373_04640 [Leptospira perolatii]|uniref:Lipoprotein n=1 Tax=Leptospira perolatii TaxID=2023191 RepID=A0A2M9ZR08_9LEPT|nr:hypothetical protein [Leptospira perolatii]PJZ68058.1 hypothetical protein CH360_18225 [Leptospira perolatii]PJZ74465.1 hypothetical protein CH373_04640 [Leptospira perolatii]